MKVKITYSQTPNEINELDLELATTPKGEWTIGRSPDCDLPLESPDVSRIHGKFFIQNRNYYFSDLGSRNGSIINDKLAEKNLPYILKHGDSIRIGDYILILEDIKPASEQLAETVFRVIDPSLFSRPVSENINVANITNQASEVVSEFTGAIISPTQEEVAAPEVVNTASSLDNEVITAPESPIAEESTFVQPQDIANQPPEIVNDVATTDSDNEVDLATPIVEERTFVQSRNLANQPPEIVNDVATTDSDDEVGLATPIVEERTFVQSRNLANQPPEIVTDVATTDSDEEVDLAAPILPEFTTVQPRNPVIQPSLSVSDLPTTDSDESVDLDIGAGGEVETLEVVSEVPAEVTTELNTVTENTSIEVHDLVSQPPEVVSNVDAQATEVVPESLNEFQAEVPIAPEDNIQAPAEVPEVFSNEYIDFSSTSLAEVSQESTTADVVSTAEPLERDASISTAEVSQESTTADVVSTAEPLEIDASISTAEVSQESTTTDVVSTAEPLEIDASISTAEVSAESTTADVVSTAEPLEIYSYISAAEVSHTPELVGQTPKEVAEVEKVLAVDSVEVDTESEPSQMSIQKNIVLIAHESKKSELAELVSQYQEFFSQSLTISWPSVSEVLNQQAGITVSQEIPSPTSGGYQKINLLLNSGDILAVIFLRDFLTPQTGQANEEALLRICNINQVLLATNLKTAEAIVHYLQHISA